MAPFESLPDDIVILILCCLTVRSCKAVCRASKVYNAVFLCHQSLIESKLFLQEALGRYAAEAIWLSRHHDRLRGSVGRPYAQVSLAYMDYASYPDPSPFNELGENRFSRLEDHGRANLDYPDPDTYEQFISDIADEENKCIRRLYGDGGFEVIRQSYNGPQLSRDDKCKIVSYHRTVIYIYERFIRHEILRREITFCAGAAQRSLGEVRKRSSDRHLGIRPPRRDRGCIYLWASIEEEERIIESVYRFFVSFDMRASMKIGRYLPLYCFDMSAFWNLWSTVGVRAIRDFLYEELCRSGRWQLLNTSRKRRPARDFRFPILYEFPENLALWLHPDTPLERLEKRSETIKRECTKHTKAFYNTYSYLTPYRYRLYPHIPRFYFLSLDWFRGDSSGYQSSHCRSPILDRKGTPIQHMRLLAPAKKYWDVPEDRRFAAQPITFHKEGKYISEFSITTTDGLYPKRKMDDRFDLYAGLWDEARLQEWGYQRCRWGLCASDRESFTNSGYPRDYAENFYDYYDDGDYYYYYDSYSDSNYEDDYLEQGWETEIENSVHAELMAPEEKINRYKSQRKWKKESKEKREKRKARASTVKQESRKVRPSTKVKPKRGMHMRLEIGDINEHIQEMYMVEHDTSWLSDNESDYLEG